MQAASQDGLSIPGYSHLTRLAANGASSVLYSAVRNAFGDRVAIKVVTQSLAGEGSMMLFERECEALKMLRDATGIVALFDSGRTAAGNPYMVMPLFDRSLEDVLLRRGPLSWPRMALIMSAISDATARAHAANILHRDIKPANILLTAEGAPYLADFGIARFRETTTIAEGFSGTIEYLAPGIITGEEDPCEASDVYALGMTCLVALNGQSPFRETLHDPPYAVMRRVTEGPTPEPSDYRLDGAAARVIRASIDREPHHRPTASELAAELQDLVPEQSPNVRVRQPTPLPPRVEAPVNARGMHPPVFRRSA